MGSWVAHYGQDGFDVLLLVMFLVASAGWFVQARGRDRAEDEADRAWRDGWEDGHLVGLNSRPEPEPEPAWRDQDTFYQPPPPEPDTNWRVTMAAELQRFDDDRMAWCQEVGIPFEPLAELVPA